MNKSRILLFDIETMANLGFFWGYYEQNILEITRPWYMITFAYKWLGEKKIHYYSLPDFKEFKRNRFSDKSLCKKLWKLMDEADVVMAHNGFSFDVKKAQARFIKHKFKPPSPFQQIDTKKVAKKHFRFDCNKLEELAKFLGIGRKLPHEGWNLWTGCAVRNEPKAWHKMIDYNKHDVVLLEEVYKRMRPWMDNHPNLNLLNETKERCPNCGGIVTRAGTRMTLGGKWQRYRCIECGASSQKPITKKKKGIIR